jgi:Spy/CpxP family protein refolding chaperone
MKRRLWFTSAALAIAAAVSLPLVAQSTQGPGSRGPERSGAVRPGPGGPGRGGPMGQLRGIELTDGQREQIRAIHESARDDGSRSKLGELQTQLQAAIFADTSICRRSRR